MSVTDTRSSYNYVVTANRPTNVRHSVVGNFTGATDVNLILSKETRLEIWTLTEDGLKGVADVPIYGRIAVLELFRPPGQQQDVIFLSTERYNFCVLEWDSAKEEFRTRAGGNVEDRVGRPAEEGQMGVVDPHCHLIGLHLYHGLLKVIPMSPSGELDEAFNIRLEELEVLDLKFLHVPVGEAPLLAVLYQDLKQARHVRTYRVSFKDKELRAGPWSQQDLDAGATKVIPIPLPLGGAVVLGENVIAYFAEHQGRPICMPIAPTIISAYGKVDDNGSRWLLGDNMGRLSLLALVAVDGCVASLRHEALGNTSPAATLSYLDNGVVYVGSARGDSQLVRLSATPVGGSGGATPSFLEVLENYTSLGPIVDFAVVDLERQGQGQVVTCSGVNLSGSLRIVRNGIGTTEQASIELPGIKGAWSLKASSSDAFDKFLVLTFVGETRVLAITDDDELDEAELPGFDADAQTLHCSNVAPDQILQVTRGTVRLVSAATQQLSHQWTPPAGSSINLAAANPTQVLLALERGVLILLGIQDGAFTEAARLTLNSEISCLDISPLGEDTSVAQLATVATWAMDLLVYRLPSLQQIAKEDLGGEVIPRSVLMADFEEAGPHLLCALGDGQLHNFRLDAATGELSDRKRVSLGTKPIALRSFRSGGARHVFAACDRPAVIYAANKKLLFSNVNDDEINVMTSFNSSGFPDSLAVAKEETLSIGTIDEVQKLHIQTVPLGEQPRRIAHQDASRTYAVAVESVDPNDPEIKNCAVRLFDDQTFETKDRFELEPNEQGTAMVSGSLVDDPAAYYLVGTAFALPEEQEPSRGRILVLQVREEKLVLVVAKEVRGATWSINIFQGKVLASIGSRVQIFKWAAREGSPELVVECGYGGFVTALFVEHLGESILVGDIMRSLQLLTYKAEEGALVARARDYNTNWVTAMSVLDEETFLASENSYNLFTVARNSDAAADEERNHLATVGRYHLGEFVNRIQRGSLVMKMPDSEQVEIPTQLFATISGVIGVVAQLPKDKFEKLIKLQDALRNIIGGVGGFSHSEYRSFRNESNAGEDATGFIDGDLIEQFLDLQPNDAAAAAAQMGPDFTPESVSKLVEEVARLH